LGHGTRRAELQFAARRPHAYPNNTRLFEVRPVHSVEERQVIAISAKLHEVIAEARPERKENKPHAGREERLA
jgi:hypothetical protein